jgi:hypothetical protein
MGVRMLTGMNSDAISVDTQRVSANTALQPER